MNSKDIRQIEARGSSLRAVEGQIACFKKGFPWMKIVGAATPQRGILVLSEKKMEEAVSYADSAPTAGRCKFVPASGAASRMFKDMFSALSALESGAPLPEGAPAAKLVSKIDRFAFYREDVFGKAGEKSPREILSLLLRDEGLGYGSKPKGVLDFHRYASGEVRTAIAEHLVEAATYMRNPDGTCNIVITISPEHRALFESVLEKAVPEYEKRFGVKYNITFTFQDRATDTIAVDTANRPFRTLDGDLLFRPGGHGALIHNLNAVSEELVSIKNIDNVAHEKLLPITSKYKKVLIGTALMLRDRIFDYLRRLDSVDPLSPEGRALLNDAESFLDSTLCIQIPLERSEKDRFESIRARLNRPIRVCGMVRNEGEPGGGPFIIAGRDGATSLQILESVQINREDSGAMEALSRATHFNPVDLVCCLHDYKGRKFNLLDHVDPKTGFISSKSYEGRELRALELPGLWNGAMADWNTLFVEVPLETFNPVKTVLDLLRPAHQSYEA